MAARGNCSLHSVWLDAWERGQAALRASAAARHVVFIRPNRGLGDVLAGLLSAFWLAFLQGRVLHVFWPEAVGAIAWGPGVLPIGSVDALPELDKLLDDASFDVCLSRLKKGTCSAANGQLVLVKFMQHGKHLVKYLRALDRSSRSEPAVRWEVLTGNRGIVSWLVTHEPWASRMPMAARRPSGAELSACVLERLIRPTAAAARAVAHELVETTASLRARADVCMQIRTGVLLRQARLAAAAPRDGRRRRLKRVDASRDGGSDGADVELASGRSGPPLRARNFTAFFDCARAVERAHGGAASARWFVTTDSASLRADVLRLFPGKVQTTSFEARHSASGGGTWTALRDRGALRAAEQGDGSEASALVEQVAEWWLLSHCRRLIVSPSGFGLTAAAVAQAARNAAAYLLNDAHDAGPAGCDRSTPTAVDFAVERAGL